MLILLHFSGGSHGCYPDKRMPLLHLDAAQHRAGSMCFLVGMGGKACRPGRSWCSSPGCCCCHGPAHGPAAILLQTLFGNSCFSHLPACYIAISTTLFVSGICVRVPGQAAHTLRVNQLVPYPIYSCHPLIYKLHGAIKVKTLSSVLQDLFFNPPNLLLCR